MASSTVEISVCKLKCPDCKCHTSGLDFLSPLPASAGLVAASSWTVAELRSKLGQLDRLRSHIMTLINDDSHSSPLISYPRGTSSSHDDVKEQSSYSIEVGNYHVTRLDENGQRALQLLTTHDNIAFKLKGVCFFSPRDARTDAVVEQRTKEFAKRYNGQEFHVSIACLRRVFMVSSRQSKTHRDTAGNQYRQCRAFSTIKDAQFESVDGSKLRVSFDNGRGFFVLSFSSSNESTMIMSICNIIAQNDEYHSDIEHQLVWAGYVQKKGRRMGWTSHRFLVLRNVNLEMYRSHTNYLNGEEPSFRTPLLECDFSDKQKDARDVRINFQQIARAKDKDSANMVLRMASDTERGDFLNLCAKTVMDCIHETKARMARSSPAGVTMPTPKLADYRRSQLSTPTGGGLVSVSAPVSFTVPVSGRPRHAAISPRRLGVSMEVSPVDSDSEQREDDAKTPETEVMAVSGSKMTTTFGMAMPLDRTPGRSLDQEFVGEDDDDEEEESPWGQTPGASFADGGGLGVGIGIVSQGSLKRSFLDSAKSLMLVSDSIVEKRSARHWRYSDMLSKTPRMYGASHMKVLDRLAKRRTSDVDFIESTFAGGEYRLEAQSNTFLQTFALMTVIGQSMATGAFLSDKVYVHKAVWSQNRVFLTHYEDKLEVFAVVNKCLSDACKKVTVEWIAAGGYRKNGTAFHKRLAKCIRQLTEAQTEMQSFVDKSVKKQKKKGIGKLYSSLKDKSRGKVHDNSDYREHIRIICHCSSQMETFYKHLTQPSVTAVDAILLRSDLEKMCKYLITFTKVVFSDMKEFVRSYLKRGAKNLYE